MTSTPSQTPHRPPPPEGGGAEAAGTTRPHAPFWKRLLEQVQADDVPTHGAHIAFFSFLSIPPTILALFAFTGLFGGEGVAGWITDRLEQSLPGEASTLIDDFVEQVIDDAGVGPLSIGILVALWAGSNVFMAMSRSFEHAYGVEESRPWLKQRALSVGVMAVFLLLFLAGSALILAGPAIAGALDLFGVAETVWAIVQWPLALCLVIAALWICYYVLPARDQAGEKLNLLIGATAAALLWLLATAGFRLYVQNLASYGETYGFLGAVIILLIWLWITGMVILLGAEIGCVLRPRGREEGSG